jgi:hypothetical protein
LARRLFTVATAILGDATLAAGNGQSSKLTETSCEGLAGELRQIGDDLVTIAGAAAIMVRLSRQMSRKLPHKHSR